MKICRICRKESSEEADVCGHCSAPFDLSKEEVKAIDRFFQNLVRRESEKMGLRNLRRDEAYVLYKLAPRVLGTCLSEI